MVHQDNYLQYIKEAHNNSNHLGREHTLLELGKFSVFLPGSKRIIDAYIKSCSICMQKNSSSFKQPYKAIFTTAPGDRIIMDYTFLPQDPLGYSCILVIIDHFTKVAWAWPFKSKESENVLNCLSFIISYFDSVKLVASDNGSEFKNVSVQNLINNNGAGFLYGPPYHPQTQGAVERFNKTLKDHLKVLTKQQDKPWSELVQQATYIYNNSFHHTLQFTPKDAFEGCYDKPQNPNNSETLKKSLSTRKYYLDHIQANQIKFYNKEQRKSRNQVNQMILIEGDLVAVKMNSSERHENIMQFLYPYYASVYQCINNNDQSSKAYKLLWKGTITPRGETAPGQVSGYVYHEDRLKPMENEQNYIYITVVIMWKMHLMNVIIEFPLVLM
jgi:transposase InsO family protein